jgi:hypothetical protein
MNSRSRPVSIIAFGGVLFLITTAHHAFEIAGSVEILRKRYVLPRPRSAQVNYRSVSAL